MGFRSIEIVVEDITRILNVDMYEEVNELEEVSISKTKKSEHGVTVMGKPSKMKTNFGTIDVGSSGYSIEYVSGDELNLAAINLATAIQGKFPNAGGRSTLSINNAKPPIWEIDGVIYADNPPFIDLSTIKEVFFLKSLAGTVKYGTIAVGGIYIVKTRQNDFSRKLQEKKRIQQEILNKEYFQNDALPYNQYAEFEPPYLKRFDSLTTAESVFQAYTESGDNLKTDAYYALAVAQKLHQKFGASPYINQIMETTRDRHPDNPEVLKSLAYFLQAQGQYDEALVIYRKLLALRPDYAQSYRDLANSLVETKAYGQAWKTYMQYLNKTGKLTETGVDKLVFDEMQELFNQKRKQLPPEAGMETAGPEETQQDVRLVFEWDTSEAEFEIEFVNPGNQVFVFDHTYKNNNELFTDEKTKGYSSEKFYIETLGTGQWMVNLTYHGNKKYDPTYLKATIYYNWGRANQHQETKVFKLLQTGIKTNLLMLSQANLVVQD